MDTTAPNIVFFDDGTCNFCRDYDLRCAKVVFEDEAAKAHRRHLLIDEIKKDGRGKPYDCVVGVSGGVDSSFVLHLAKQEGLRPLAVHMDNNWNSELAVNNIKNLIDGLGIDLHTHVINWFEYREMMEAFFDADVVDVELLYDNAMTAVNYNYARQYGLKYILSGSNFATEGVDMPRGWSWIKTDRKNIRSICDRRGIKIKTFPLISTTEFVLNSVVRRIKWISFLDCYDYKKEEALETLSVKYDFKKYPYKHYESVFTRFYQGHLLPVKFGIDKRKLHLSTLILSRQVSRESALELLKGAPYPDARQLGEDIEFFLKKMRWPAAKLEAYLSRSGRNHDCYGTELHWWRFLRAVKKKLQVSR